MVALVMISRTAARRRLEKDSWRGSSVSHLGCDRQQPHYISRYIDSAILFLSGAFLLRLEGGI